MSQNIKAQEELRLLQQSITESIAKLHSLDEIHSMLANNHQITFATLENYVIKTMPPRREFTFGFQREGGQIVKKVLVIEEVQPDVFKLHGIREVESE